MSFDLHPPVSEQYTDIGPVAAERIVDRYLGRSTDTHVTVRTSETALDQHYDAAGEDVVRDALAEYLPIALWTHRPNNVDRPDGGTMPTDTWMYAQRCAEQGETPVPANSVAGIPEGDAAYLDETGEQRAQHAAACEQVDDILEDTDVQQMGGIYLIHYRAPCSDG